MTAPANELRQAGVDGEITHRTCGACYPNVKLGDTVKARCGTVKTVERFAPATTCVVCVDMVNRYPCGPGCRAGRSVWW